MNKGQDTNQYTLMLKGKQGTVTKKKVPIRRKIDLYNICISIA